MERLVHGSDATLQPSLDAFQGMAPKELLEELARIKNPLIKDMRLKRALGFPEAVFTRGAQLLGVVALREQVGARNLPPSAR